MREEDTSQPNSMEAKMRKNIDNNNYDPDREARIAHEKKKDAENNAQTEINMNSKLSNDEPAYLYAEDPKKGKNVDPSKQLKITEMQRRFDDDIDAETEGENGDLEEGGIWFGGKKKRATRRK
jgi:hypothetical protein